jgi:hypothetical protein
MCVLIEGANAACMHSATVSTHSAVRIVNYSALVIVICPIDTPSLLTCVTFVPSALESKFNTAIVLQSCIRWELFYSKKGNQNKKCFLVVVLPCILISSKLFCQQMHSLLKHKMLQLTLKVSLYMAATCFGPFGPSSGSIRRNLAKVTVFVEIISKNTSVKLLLCRGNMCFSLYSSVCTGCCAFTEETNEMLNLEHSFVWYGNSDTSEIISDIPGKL